MPTLMKLPEVTALTRRSRSRIYDDMERGDFPKAVKIGPRSVAWVESEVRDWLNARVAERAA